MKGVIDLLILKALAFILIAAGCITVYAARLIVSKTKLDLKTKCEYAGEMNDEEISEYKFKRAVVNLKMIGMLIALPGIILIFFLFRG